MRGTTQCLHSSRRALYRVFVQPSEVLEVRMHALPSIRPSTAILGSTAPVLRSDLTQLRQYAKPARQQRPGAKEKVERDERGFDRRYTTQKDIERSGRDRPPQDHEITDPQIMVIDNGATEGPLSTSFVLTKLQPEESLRMIQPYIPADVKNNKPSPQFAVCKIVNKKDEYERQRQIKEKKKANAAGKPKTKELELTWAIGEHDLATKMRQMGGFLAKGMKVDVLIARKKGGKQVDGKEAEAVVKRIREEVDVNGGREAKPGTGNAGATMRLYLEGKQVK